MQVNNKLQIYRNAKLALMLICQYYVFAKNSIVLLGSLELNNENCSRHSPVCDPELIRMKIVISYCVLGGKINRLSEQIHAIV